MTPSRPAISRRALLGVAALLPLAGCTQENRTAPAPAGAGPTTSAAAATPVATERHDQLVELEARFDARLGVYAVATDTGTTIAHRADERFAFCSSFKGLAAAAVLSRHPLSYLDERVRYTEKDLMDSSKITERHVATGMTIGEVCDAAVRHSDGTAGNLLFRELGGPAELTAYLRDLGDTVTRSDRTEPTLTHFTPGDPRDTTSPMAIGEDYRKIVLGEALPSDKRDYLRDLLERANVSVAGKRRIRAGVPSGWTVADKTGTGDHATANDIAIVSPPNSAPLVVSIMSSRADKDAKNDDALIAAAAQYVVATLT